jgi:hypothetical protein
MAEFCLLRQAYFKLKAEPGLGKHTKVMSDQRSHILVAARSASQSMVQWNSAHTERLKEAGEKRTVVTSSR